VTLLFVFGPPAVGKMTVGRTIADAGDFRLFHNHHVIEPLLDVFDYGTPPFHRLLGEFRRRVLEEAAESGTDLVFTFVWALELTEEVEIVERYLAPFERAGARIAFVELYADLETRLERNRTDYRLAEKKSKRDVAWSDGNVRELERYQMGTGTPAPGDAVLARHPFLRIDNTALSAEETARRVLAWLDSLPPAADS
jgi:hypothetical protein